MEYLSLLENFYFPIFPEGSLAHSIITTVWIGVLVVAFFNLRYGWVLSGLVVPGYITPLLLVKPIAVWVIGIESIVVYLIVYFVGKIGIRYGLFSDLFGRDRFFALLLMSVIVRTFFDGWLLPEVGQWYVEYTGDPFDYRNNLHSFGLIIIALIANMLWKPGLIKGLPPLVIIILVTYIITRFVLIEGTNFTLSNLSYMYEDFSSNILASPKSYIILLTTAYIASRMNLRYGWDFNGILIPSLLALQWYQPSKIFISFAEAFIIYFIATLVLKLSFFKNMNIEGARKLLLFFNIGFFYKIVLSYFLIEYFPEVKISDYFGFGYLLSTLIAIKMYDKDVMALFFRATLQTSFVSIIVATIIGFSLTLGNKLFLQDTFIVENIPNKKVKHIDDLNEYLLQEKIKLYENIKPESFISPSQKELFIFSNEINRLINVDNIKEAEKIILELSTIGLYGVIAQNRYVVFTQESKKGWGIYLMDLKNKSNLLVSVPAPLEEWGTFESGIVLLKKLNAKALSIAGAKRDVNAAGEADVLSNKATLFYTFFESFNKENTIMLRGYSSSIARKIFTKRYDKENFEITDIKNSIFINNKIPKDINLQTLKKLTDDLNIVWSKAPIKHLYNSTYHDGFSELFLTKESRRKILSSLFATEKLEIKQTYQRIDGYFQEWILNEKNSIAKKNSQSYEQPTLQELLYFDNEVLKPLINFVLENQDYNSKWDESLENELNSIASVASLVNYKLLHYHHIGTKQDYLLLIENNKDKKYRGTYALRFGDSKAFTVQIPRPLYEKNTFEYGVSLFERTKAMAILIGGSHPNANNDRSADLLRYGNKRSFYSVFNQVLLRELKQKEHLSIVCRAFGNRAYGEVSDEDVILSFDKGYTTKEQLTLLPLTLYDFISNDGLNLSLANGAQSKAGYESTNITQSLYLSQTINKEFASVWLSSDLRRSYNQKEKDSYTIRQMSSLGVPIKDISLEQWMKSINLTIAKENELNLLNSYIQTKDPILLMKLKRKENYTLEVIHDSTTKIPFLILKYKGAVSVILKLQNGLNGTVVKMDKLNFHESISRWIYSKDILIKVVK